ncbi:Hypothetical protein FKW44_022282, partial [Caligus rogercresseyi]
DCPNGRKKIIPVLSDFDSSTSPDSPSSPSSYPPVLEKPKGDGGGGRRKSNGGSFEETEEKKKKSSSGLKKLKSSY